MNIMEFKLPRGMRDIEPAEYAIIEEVREAFKQTCKVFNFRIMEPSPIEMLSTLEAKGDLAIRDEIYYFKDKGDRELGLRFDLTVGITRNITQKKGIVLPVKIGTFGSMFRYDEPQYGRYRWFHQWNAEIYGENELEAEAEIIDFTTFLFNILGLKSGELTSALINPLFGSRATTAPFLPANSFRAKTCNSLSKPR